MVAAKDDNRAASFMRESEHQAEDAAALMKAHLANLDSDSSVDLDEHRGDLKTLLRQQLDAKHRAHEMVKDEQTLAADVAATTRKEMANDLSSSAKVATAKWRQQTEKASAEKKR